MKKAKTIAAVYTALGENAGVERLTGASPQSVSNWRADGVFPPYWYVVMIDALRKKGVEAPPRLWQMSVSRQKKGRK